MRFLFTSVPMTGHFHAMAPYARALRDRGHDVAFATGARFGEFVRRTGFEHFACGFDFDGSSDIFAVLPGWDAIRERFASAPPLAQLHGFVEGLAPRMAADLAPVMNAWKPAVVVRDLLEYGGYVAAERAQVPHATVNWGIYIAPQQVARDAMRALRAHHGLVDDPALSSLDRFLLLSALPSSWLYPECPVSEVLHRFSVPPFDTSGDERLPTWMSELADRPTVYATLGTTFNQAPATFRALIQAFGGEEFEAIITVGRNLDPGQLGVLPGNVRAARYIPQTLLLPRCQAIVFHAGFNSIHSALWHGLPMVLMPMGAGDQLLNARHCAALGAAIVVEGQPPAPQALRAAVRAVLREPGPRARAQALRQELNALPQLSAAVDLLERLGRSREPQCGGGAGTGR